ncbi:hypothetical protein G6F22_019022 [Rhizopus arrhizus]|nr:hypothetical protein G6F22_019022 [Rhizopus arrhizus]
MTDVEITASATSPYEDAAQGLPPGKPALTIGIVLMDQFTLAAFAGLVDVLRLAGDHGGRSRQIHTAWRPARRPRPVLLRGRVRGQRLHQRPHARAAARLATPGGGAAGAFAGPLHRYLRAGASRRDRAPHGMRALECA